MSEVIGILSIIDQGDLRAAAQLMPLVDTELRKLAVQKLAKVRHAQTLNATALVHEAYLRPVGNQHFSGRGHFFVAAAQAITRGIC